MPTRYCRNQNMKFYKKKFFSSTYLSTLILRMSDNTSYCQPHPFFVVLRQKTAPHWICNNILVEFNWPILNSLNKATYRIHLKSQPFSNFLFCGLPSSESFRWKCLLGWIVSNVAVTRKRYSNSIGQINRKVETMLRIIHYSACWKINVV